MPKQVIKAEITSFVKGIISESSPLNFPADASRDEENFDLNKDGSRSRRLGIDLEINATIRDTGFNTSSIIDAVCSSFLWFNAGNNSLNEFAVVQIGNRVHVFDTAKVSISTDGFIGTVVLATISSSTKLSYASIDGTLVIAAGTDVIHIINYNGSTLTYTQDRLLIRDLWGLPGNDKNDINKRPTASDAHKYNLL